MDDTAGAAKAGGAAPRTGGRAGDGALDPLADPAEAPVVGSDTLFCVAGLQLCNVVGSKALEGIAAAVGRLCETGILEERLQLVWDLALEVFRHRLVLRGVRLADVVQPGRVQAEDVPLVGFGDLRVAPLRVENL